jgi:hypothetical protein
MTAVQDFPRPLTVHELETWLSQHDPDLWVEVSEKCHDYVRVILSLSPDESLIKYRCRAVLPGTDHRACFFGSPALAYDPMLWSPITRKGKRPNPKLRPSHAPKPLEQRRPVRTQPSTFFPEHPILPFEEDVDGNTYRYSWFVLETLVPPTNQLWPVFRDAIASIRARVEGGSRPEIVLTELLQADQALTHPMIAQEVVHILSREAMIHRRKSASESELDSGPEPLFLEVA